MKPCGTWFNVVNFNGADLDTRHNTGTNSYFREESKTNRVDELLVGDRYGAFDQSTQCADCDRN